MFKVLCVSFSMVTAGFAAAQEGSAAADSTPPSIIQSGDAADLSEFLWKNRPLVVLADTPDDPRYVQQMTLIEDRSDELAERDVVVLTDTDPAARGPLRQKLRPRGFMLVLVGKDGTIYLRKPFPWDVREITRVIDKLPLRQQEIRDGLSDG